MKQCLEKNFDLIAIDNEYSEEYRKALYDAQKSNNSEALVKVFKKCQDRVNEKLAQYENLLEQVEDILKELN